MNQAKAKNVRLYSCKNEDLPVMGGYVLFSFRRDLTDFRAYSPVFNEEYATDFDMQNKTVTELVIPVTETNAIKLITERLYACMDGLIDPINRLTGYVDLAGKEYGVTVIDFGLTALRRRAVARDASGTLQNLRTVIANIGKYKTALTAKGLSDELIGKFTGAVTAITADNQTQYEMTENRKAIVQENIHVLNGLYLKMKEICKVGKILYAGDPVKLSEYTIAELKRKASSSRKGSQKQNNDEAKGLE
jgi:hypothetical protein